MWFEPDGCEMADRLQAAFPHARWTQTDITNLRERAGSGAPLTELVMLLGRSAEDVRHMMIRLRIVLQDDR